MSKNDLPRVIARLIAWSPVLALVGWLIWHLIGEIIKEVPLISPWGWAFMIGAAVWATAVVYLDHRALEDKKNR